MKEAFDKHLMNERANFSIKIFKVQNIYITKAVYDLYKSEIELHFCFDWDSHYILKYKNWNKDGMS